MTNAAYCCDKLLPDRPLMKYVDYFYVLRGQSSETLPVEPWFPGGTMDIVFDLGAPFEQGMVSGLMKKRPQAFVAGLFESGLRIRPTGNVHQIGVVFKPGRFRQFIKGHQMDYKGQIAPLREVFGPMADGIVDQLQSMDNDRNRISLIQSFLSQSFRPDVQTNPFIEYCVDSLQTHPARTSLPEIGRRARISSRHFRRLFKEYVGISPKLFSMMMRLEILIRHSISDSQKLYQIADELGYYDPSHLARDFKSLSGMRAIDFLSSPNLIAKTFINS